MKNNKKYRYIPLLLSFTYIFLSINTSIYAQDKIDEIDKIFDWTKSNEPGCSVAVSHNGKSVINKAYGLADVERDVSLTTNSTFDIGSTQKQFAAAAALLLVEDKKLSLSEDIRKHLTELPDYGHKITIDHLMTHTSGVREWLGLHSLAGRDKDVLELILKQRGLNFAPGEEWSYSNSGFVLLKEIVARASGMPFAEFARQRLFEPLGMKSTTYSVDMLDIVKNRAIAYEKEKTGLKIAMRIGENRGGGGILSTPSDLLIWNEALASGRLSKFVTEKIHEPARLNNGRKLGYARGLFLMETNAGDKMIWHSGGAAGYSTWLGRMPDHGLSIALMCNVEPLSSSQLADKIIDQFLPPKKGETPVGSGPPPVVPEEFDVKSKAGLYINEENGGTLNLVVDRGRFRVAGGPGLEAISDKSFKRWGSGIMFMSGDEFEINFPSNDKLELKTMEGKTVIYRRAKPFAPTAADLKKFAGEYINDETRAVFEVKPGNESLMLSLNDSRAFEFKPVDRDTFQFGPLLLKFQRDKGGKVTGVEYSSPVLRRIKFTRFGE